MNSLSNEANASQSHSFKSALAELFVMCSPFLILLFALWLFGSLDSILDRTDLALFAGALFADGAYRVGKSPNVKQDLRVLMLAFGILAAIFCAVAAMSVLAVESPNMTSAANKLGILARAGTYSFYAFLAGILYSLASRYIAP